MEIEKENQHSAPGCVESLFHLSFIAISMDTISWEMGKRHVQGHSGKTWQGRDFHPGLKDPKDHLLPNQLCVFHLVLEDAIITQGLC